MASVYNDIIFLADFPTETSHYVMMLFYVSLSQATSSVSHLSPLFLFSVSLLLWNVQGLQFNTHG